MGSFKKLLRNIYTFVIDEYGQTSPYTGEVLISQVVRLFHKEMKTQCKGLYINRLRDR